VSPFVASAGSLFASMVKSDDESLVIGQETLGGYYGHTGHIPVTYRLPKTGLLLTFSIVDLEQDVQKLSDQTYGDGIKPDYPVEQTIEEYFQSTDTLLEFAKKMIHH
jgi:C-terminal processing protease CtpA/Prc